MSAAPILLMLMTAAALSEKTPPADLVLTHGNVITLDDMRPRASAVAVVGEAIVYVGDDAGAKALIGPQTQALDLGGRTLIPGFNDVHLHALQTGLFFLEPNLWGKSCDEIAAVVAAEAKKIPPGGMITGNSWDYPTCPQPHRKILDAAAPGHLVALTQYSGHAVWVNSALLKKVGITARTPDPAGGKIVRDPDGQPTGVLREKAAYPVQIRANLLVPAARREQCLLEALRLFRENGITSVQDNTWDPRTVFLLRRLQREGRLTCRFTCWSFGGYAAGPWAMALGRYDDAWVRQGPVKLYADGAFSTRTGWLTEPYAGEPDNYGLPNLTPKQLAGSYRRAARSGQQLAMHAIGDRAVTEVLGAVERSAARRPEVTSLRHRLEHVQLVLPGDFSRLARLGMVAAIQPFAAGQPDKDVALLGLTRAAAAYPYRSLLEAGVAVGMGSDAPAEVDFQPLLGIYYAVTRQNKDGDQGPLNPAERLTPEQALRAYTVGSAYAEFMEDRKGTIAAGKLADLVVLDGDPLAIAPEAIKDLRVEMTVVGGRVVYAAGR